MASNDRRHLDARFPIARYEFTQQTFPATATTALTDTLYDVCGTIKAIEILVAETEDNITYTVAIADENSAALFSEAALADLTNHWRDSESGKGTQDADFNPIPVNGNLTVTITPSAKPDAASVGDHTATVDVILYLE